MKKQIAILGSTGSIGTQALQVIGEHPDLYEAYVLTANNRVDELIAQARRFTPEVVVIANEAKYAILKEALADLPIKVYAGEEAMPSAPARPSRWPTRRHSSWQATSSTTWPA